MSCTFYMIIERSNKIFSMNFHKSNYTYRFNIGWFIFGVHTSNLEYTMIDCEMMITELIRINKTYEEFINGYFERTDTMVDKQRLN